MGFNPDFRLCVSAGTFCTPRIYYALVILLMAVVVPLVVYITIPLSSAESKSELWTCSINVDYR
jgi:hypothetical protein